MQHHVFISYARKDNEPRRPDGKGWVHLFRDRLETRYKALTGRDLKVFFDEERIESGAHWETAIQGALRQSRIFIAILSPHYLASPICRMELEDYIRYEQSVTPGGDGVQPIYFATAADLEGSDSAADDDGRARLIRDLNRRNRARGLDWRDWREVGVQALLGLDADERLAELERNPQPPLDRFVAGIGQLSDAISKRLDDVALAELARANGNLTGSHKTFVGRSLEIAQIHQTLIHNPVQVVTALHGLGGQGKSALARQYAHAFASYYAAGGRWEVDCERLGEGLGPDARADRCTLLALAFERLLDRMQPKGPPDPRHAGLRLSPEEQRLPPEERLRATLARLKAFTVEGWDARLAALRAGVADVHGTWPQDHPPRLLVIFDNVDSRGFMNEQAAQVLDSPDWLEMIVTTRLAPTEIGPVGKDRAIQALQVDHLPLGDAVELMRRLMRDTRPSLDDAERAALRALASDLGGFTLAVELAGAYLATYPKVTIAGYLRRLRADGLATVDQAQTEGSRSEEVRDLILHREGQVGLIVAQTLEGLSAVEIDVLHLASHFPPDHVVLTWLRSAAGLVHPDLTTTPDDREAPWDAVTARLVGRRLLAETEMPGTCRLHRMVRDHLRRGAGPERLARDREVAISVLEAIGSAMEVEGFGWKSNPVGWRPFWPAFYALIDTLLAEGAAEARTLQSLGISVDIEATTGSFNKAEQLYERHLSIAKDLAKANPTDALARRDLSVSQSTIGDFYLRRGAPGDAELALEAYQASLATREELAKANPTDAHTRRDLSLSQVRIGDYYLRRGAPGDADRALAAYQASLATREELAKANPTDAQAGRDLSVSQERIGYFYLRRGAPGDAERALAAYQVSLATLEELAKANPSDAEARHGLSVLQDRIGDFYLRRGAPGDAELALAAYQASLATREQLANDSPSDARARRDLSVSQNKIGDFYLRQGAPENADRALAAYQVSLATLEELAKANQTDAEARRDLSVSQGRIGDFYLRRGAPGDAERALAAYQASLATDEDMAKANPNDAGASWDLVVSLYKMGQVLAEAGDAASATSYLRRALDILEGMEAEGRDMSAEMRGGLETLRKMFKPRARGSNG